MLIKLINYRKSSIRFLLQLLLGKKKYIKRIIITIIILFFIQCLTWHLIPIAIILVSLGILAFWHYFIYINLQAEKLHLK